MPMSKPLHTGSLKRDQYRFSAHLRDPASQPAPAGVEERRLAIYRDLIYNNIEGFIRGGFPTLREITGDARWHAMVRDFIRCHRAHSPYFREISQEFLDYLQRERQVQDDPPFLLELAHYEWVELALDVSTSVFPEELPGQPDLLISLLRLSPLAWNLSYEFPVHQIGPAYQPTEPPAQPTFLVVYRNRREQVRFLESNAATSRLLTLLSGRAPLTGLQALLLLADELQAPNSQSIIDFGKELLEKLWSLDIIV
jgi:uncharacterized protein